MKNKTKKSMAWILIIVPALFIWYHAFINGAFTTSSQHTLVFIAVAIWIIGDILLSKTKR